MLKNSYQMLSIKILFSLTDLERTYGYQTGKDEEKGYLGTFDGHVYTVIFKMYKQQGPIGQHMELCSMLFAAWTGGEFGGELIHVYV